MSEISKVILNARLKVLREVEDEVRQDYEAARLEAEYVERERKKIFERLQEVRRTQTKLERELVAS